MTSGADRARPGDRRWTSIIATATIAHAVLLLNADHAPIGVCASFTLGAEEHAQTARLVPAP